MENCACNDGGTVDYEARSSEESEMTEDIDDGYHRVVEGEDAFGEEPDDEGVQGPWACNHSWERVKPEADGNPERRMECYSCFREVFALSSSKPVVKQDSSARSASETTQANRVEPASSKVAYNVRLRDAVAYECTCEAIICRRCRDGELLKVKQSSAAVPK
ncbi:MAG: hypothetical protein M1833_000634 [Piccolia ochrophora]|nr:MAG: hypothetical protein M1833_000634 [Piccolia ochrophora]